MAISRIISEIQRAIGRKLRFFSYHSAFDAPDMRESPSKYCYAVRYEQTGVMWLLGSVKGLFSHFDRIPDVWRTDGVADKQTETDGRIFCNSMVIICRIILDESFRRAFLWPFSASCDLSLLPPERPPSWSFRLLAPCTTCANFCIKVDSFFWKISCSQFGNRQTNGRTNGQTENTAAYIRFIKYRWL